MQELLEFLNLVWQLRFLVIVLIILVLVFLCWGKIVSVIKDTKETFGKGGKNAE